MGAPLLERRVRELVDEQELGLRDVRDVAERSLRFGAGEGTKQRAGAREQNRVPSLYRRTADADCEVRLADAWWSEHQHVLAVDDEAALGGLANESLIDRSLELEVEVVEAFHRREGATVMPIATRLHGFAPTSSRSRLSIKSR